MRSVNIEEFGHFVRIVFIAASLVGVLGAEDGKGFIPVDEIIQDGRSIRKLCSRTKATLTECGGSSSYIGDSFGLTRLYQISQTEIGFLRGVVAEIKKDILSAGWQIVGDFPENAIVDVERALVEYKGMPPSNRRGMIRLCQISGSDEKAFVMIVVHESGDAKQVKIMDDQGPGK